jgi:hypothetical protein
MAYTRTTWANGSGGGTPLSAANLNNIETYLVSIDIEPATSLPGSPVDRQRAILVDSTTAPTYAWMFQYESGISDSNKWLFVGGAPAVVEIATAQTKTAGASYGALGTAGPSFAIPRAGVYNVTIGAQASTGAGGSGDAFISYDIGGTGAVDTDAANATIVGVSIKATVSKVRPKTLTAVTLTAKYKAVTQDITFSERTISVIPVRVA